MSDPHAPELDQLKHDVHQAWSYALNADLGRDIDAITDAGDRQRAPWRRDAPGMRYARYLLHDLDAEPDRLTEVAAACRAEHTRRIDAGYASTGGYATAAHLAELGLDTIRQAEAGAGPAGREQLRAELDREHSWSPIPYRQGTWHRHRWPRRAVRRLNPLWWCRRLHAALTVCMTCGPYDGNSDFQQVTITMGEREIGGLVFQICSQCRTGHVAKSPSITSTKAVASGAVRCGRYVPKCPATAGRPVARTSPPVPSGNARRAVPAPATRPPSRANISRTRRAAPDPTNPPRTPVVSLDDAGRADVGWPMMKRVDDQAGHGTRIETADGQVLHLHRDPATGLAFLDLESRAGELIASRVIDGDDARRLGDAFTAAGEHARVAEVPVVLDLSVVLGRD